MLKKSLKLLFFLFFCFSFLSLSQVALADQCRQGETQTCNDCGIQACLCRDEVIDSIIVTTCDWGPCQKKPTAGPCCNNNGNYKSSTTICDSQSRTQYKCEPNDQCENKVLKREQVRHKYCSGDSDQCATDWTSWQTSSSSETQCQNWQKCKDGDDWATKALYCQCAGECLVAPESPRYYDNPFYSNIDCAQESEKCQNPNNIFLPVKFDWDDVRGWKDSWIEDGEIKTCQKNCVQSYRVRIENTSLSNKKLTESEYNLRQDQGACFLDPGKEYAWHVQACCNADGTNCGPESSWSFTTNAAPELLSPEDLDWNGPEKIEGLSMKEIETLKWCVIDNAKLYKKTILEGKNYYRPLSYKVLIYYSEADFCHPNLGDQQKCNELILTARKAEGELFPSPEFWDENNSFFTAFVPYAWKVAACKDTAGVDCSDYSQLWRFKGIFALEKPIPISPKNDQETPVGLPVSIQWISPYAHSFRYKVSDSSGQIIISGTSDEFNLSFDFPFLSLNTIYNWQVQPCWDYEASDCQDVWSDPSWFRTTGRPPNPESMKPSGADIPIPVVFEWERVSGAKSYLFKAWGPNLNKEISSSEAIVSLFYPDLGQETNYSWQVKTCARENSQLCGPWSAIKTFTTFKLVAPENPFPEDGTEIFTYQIPKTFSWESEAKYFQYIFNYVEKSPQEVEECPLGKVSEGIVNSNSALIFLNCLGSYQWQVRACLDQDCQEPGEWSKVCGFMLSQKIAPGKGGLVPCGRDYDDPNTPWNEREPCQIKHLFILFRIIIDFLLWRLGLIILVLLTMLTGVIYYFSGGAQVTVINVRAIWRAAGIGYGIMFFAWMIVNFLLALSGFEVGIFGRWWQIIF